ncbi:hypothetical protein P261_00933 [Lachnospiraceae bacterium TWA4]|nr:hypothetical protein P261_00933 [Lachnospiraceae bacterium TWA4]
MYTGNPLVTKKEEKQFKQNRKEQAYQELVEKYSESLWLEEHKHLPKEQLELGVKILKALPDENSSPEYLAIFAAIVTGNPHAFDEGSSENSLLCSIIEWKMKIKREQGDSSLLYKQRLYLSVGLLKDDVSNYVMVSGLHAWKKDGKIHQGMEGFFNEQDLVQVPLQVITSWSKVTCMNNELYIVENPSVYALLCKTGCSVMCMNGQPRLSGLCLLDLLDKETTTVYYAGDFDPEGLLIAQKLKDYYRGKFVYWHMSLCDYEMSKSGEVISSRRLKMLEQITDTEFKEVVEEMRNCKRAGYQENIWERYME